MAPTILRSALIALLLAQGSLFPDELRAPIRVVGPLFICALVSMLFGSRWLDCLRNPRVFTGCVGFWRCCIRSPGNTTAIALDANPTAYLLGHAEDVFYAARPQQDSCAIENGNPAKIHFH